MKKLLHFLFIFFLFLGCKSNESVTPSTALLKSMVVESSLTNRSIKSYLNLIYANDKFSNLQRTDTLKNSDGTKSIPPTTNNIITYEATNTYKLVSDIVYATFGGAYTVGKAEYSGKKVNNTYELIIPNGSNTNYATLELNTNDQVTKFLNTKSVYINGNGVKQETALDNYIRFEYDMNGNIIKSFQKNTGAAEILTNEYTYDSNPNPNKPLLWVYRLSTFGSSAAAYESNNNIINVKSYTQGVLNSEFNLSYTYDSSTRYPLTSASTGKSYNVNLEVGVSKTVYKY